MEYIIIAVVLLVLGIVYMYFQKSTFINQMYTAPCVNKDSRTFPSGNIPGSYLGLTSAERQNLLVDFITDNPNSFNI